MELSLTTTPFIILCTYIISDVLKNFFLKSDEDRKHIPPISAAIGGLLGILVFYFVPDAISASNIVEACTSGIASGLAAVGCNQVYKQYTKFMSGDYDDE